MSAKLRGAKTAGGIKGGVDLCAGLGGLGRLVARKAEWLVEGEEEGGGGLPVGGWEG